MQLFVVFIGGWHKKMRRMHLSHIAMIMMVMMVMMMIMGVRAWFLGKILMTSHFVYRLGTHDGSSVYLGKFPDSKQRFASHVHSNTTPISTNQC